MQLMSKFNKRIRCLLRVFYIFSKYSRGIPLRDKKFTTVTNDFDKPNKLWLDIGNAFYNRSMKSWLEKMQ